MARKRQPLLAVVDLGTARTRVLAAELAGDRLRFRAYASTPSQGVQKGSVVNKEAASQAMMLAVDEAEKQAGAPIEEVMLSLTGSHIRCLQSQASISLAARSREIRPEDVHYVIEQARKIELPENSDLLHMRTIEYILDRQAGVREPAGMVASRLEARLLLIIGATGPVQNRVIAANQAHLEVLELLFTPLAAAEALLQFEEREQGVALLELGAGCTGLLVVAQGAIQYAAVIPVGGDNFTRDTAIAFNTSLPAAERMKHSFGQVRTEGMSERAEIEAPGLGEHPSRMILHREFCELLRERAEELIHLIEEELRRSGWRQRLGAGIVLAGGGAGLGGLPELIRTRLQLPVRLGAPPLLEHMPAEFSAPEYAFLLGGMMAAHRRYLRRQQQPGIWQRLWRRLETND